MFSEIFSGSHRLLEFLHLMIKTSNYFWLILNLGEKIVKFLCEHNVFMMKKIGIL